MGLFSKWRAARQDKKARSQAANLARAFVLCEAGDYRAAARICAAILRRQPEHAGSLHCQGLIALHQGWYVAAVEDLQQALGRNNADQQLRYDLAEAYRLAGRWQDAAVVYPLLVKDRPDVAQVRIGYGESLFILGRHAEAAEQCAAALRLAPDEPRALMLAADLAPQAGAIAGAETALADALAKAPQDPNLSLGMAKLWIAAGKPEQAAGLLRPLLAEGADNAQLAAVHLVQAVVRDGLPALDTSIRSAATEASLAEATASKPFISVIICSIDPVKFAAVSGQYARLLAGERHEIIGIHDARSLCEGYNRAARQAQGDILVFSHDDIEILAPDFAARLKRHLAAHHVVGACGTSRLVSGYWMEAGWSHLHGLVAHHFPAGYEDGGKAGKYRVMVFDTAAEDYTGLMQGLDGMFIAARREVFERCPFDEERFDGFHLYDLDFTFGAYLAGFDVGVFRDIPMIHYTYQDSPGYSEAFKRYQLRFEEKYRGELAPYVHDPRRFLPALFDNKEQVARFCRELLAFRRSAMERG